VLSPVPRRVLVAGASGYIGSRLVPKLLVRGHAVRCLVRSQRSLEESPWRERVDVVVGDLDGDVSEAMDGMDAAVYLVHSIGEGTGWAEGELRHAGHFRSAAERHSIERIVYLGGLGEDGSALSEHLRSRHRVGAELAAGPVAVTELRAAVVIGSGSASFEMLRYLTEVLPVMVTPKWVRTPCQPIAVGDVLHYLTAAIEHPVPIAGVVGIGGPDVVSYAQMMSMYAEEAGLSRRVLVPVPVLTPRLSSHWVGLVTPVPASLARPLVESLVNAVVVTDDRAMQLSAVRRTPLRNAIREALAVPAPPGPSHALPTDPAWSGGTELTDVRVRTSTATPAAVWAAVCRIGGERGWHAGEWLWHMRGWADQVFGGPGLRRGRIDPERLEQGDPLDFWRVEAVDPLRRLRLHAEMRLPGEAWLEWALDEQDDEGARITQTARFRPRGLLGRVYWAAVRPFHHVVFPGLLEGIVRDAEQGIWPEPPRPATAGTARRCWWAPRTWSGRRGWPGVGSRRGAPEGGLRGL